MCIRINILYPVPAGMCYFVHVLLCRLAKFDFFSKSFYKKKKKEKKEKKEKKKNELVKGKRGALCVHLI